MAQIKSADIRLYESEKLNDAADGGGRVTAREIESGKVNNVFQDISRVDHVNGSIEMRKLFMGVRTNNNAPLLGAHMIVAQPPEDPNVHVVIYQTPRPHRETDVRADARDYLETYFVRSGQGVSRPMGLNLAGSKVLTLFQDERVSNDIQSGDTIVLVDAKEGVEEYVKITQYTAAMRTFVYLGKNNEYMRFSGRVLQCHLPTPLINSWDGGEVKPTGPENRDILVYSTTITDAAQYRGSTRLADDTEPGDTIIRVDNVLAPLVPVATTETAIVDASPYISSHALRPAGTAEQTITTNIASGDSIIYLPTPITPNALRLTIAGNEWEDDGAGALVQSAGSMSIAGDIDYARGRVHITAPGNASATVRYVPAGTMQLPSVTGSIDVTQGTLGLVYTIDISDVLPVPGTLVVEYLSVGDWQEIRDRGDGVLEGMGSGLIDYQSGAAQVSLEHEPDLGSKVVYSYVPDGAEAFEQVSGAVQYTAAKLSRTINFSGPIQPGTVEISINDGEDVSVDDASGELSGDAGAGVVNYIDGVISLSALDAIEDIDYTIKAKTGAAMGSTHTVSASGRDVSLSVGGEVQPGTLSVRIPISRSRPVTSAPNYVDITDHTGTAHVVGRPAAAVTVNYSTGAITVSNLLEDYRAKVYKKLFGKVKISSSTRTRTEAVGGLASARYVRTYSGFSTRTQTERVSAATMRILDPAKRGDLVPGSLVLRIGNQRYYESDGRLLGSWSAETGAGEEVGSINMQTGEVVMRSLASSASAISVEALLLSRELAASQTLDYVIQQRPIRHASFTANYRVMGDDTPRRLTSNQSGDVIDQDSQEVVGSVDFDSGIISIDFSEIDESYAVIMGTMRYSAVNVTTLPLDPEIVGLNVQRLPIDGRVPIFKLGDTVVLNHTDTDTLGTPLAGDVIMLSRDHLAEVTVLGDGKPLKESQYTVDLEAGEIEFSGSLELVDADDNPLSGPFTVEHRIEHMSLATRVQLNGMLTLQAASAHHFPKGTSVSSAILFGDLMADVENIFSQHTWQNNLPNWTASPDSSGSTTARFDIINYPIAISNYSAITDKWALFFRTPSTVDVVSENLGVIATGLSISSQIAPINPVTEEPYFVVDPRGWGGGWATGNALRFDTTSALAPFWVARTVTPARGITAADSFVLSPRGDSQ